MLEKTANLNPPPPLPMRPSSVVLGKKACEAILSRNSVGRIAFTLHDRVSIVPIHYVYENGWIYGRTSAAGKLRGILRNRRIAFEVDENSQPFDWRSVVVKGRLYLIEPGTTPSARRVRAEAVSLIRRLVPAALTDTDPIPFRNQIFRIRIVEISGRASVPSGGKRVAIVPGPIAARPDDADADAILGQQVELALAKHHLPGGSEVHVDAFDGVVALTGTAQNSAQRTAIETAVLEVPNVLAVVQELETVFPSLQQPTPTEIAREVVRQLRSLPLASDSGIKVVAEHGWLRIEGVTHSPEIHDEVVRRLRGVKGSRGVIDRLCVTAPATAQFVSD